MIAAEFEGEVRQLQDRHADRGPTICDPWATAVQEMGALCEQMGIGDLRPVKPFHRAGRNKAGRLVARGRIEGRDVKVYEAASAEHARFIQAVSRHAHLAGLFPAVIDVRQSFVVAEWVNGGLRAVVRPQDLAGLLCRVHQANPENLPAPGFDYWRDVVYPRFLRTSEVLGELALARDIDAQVSEAWRRPVCLMHPDCTMANVVRESALDLYIIDNELLCLGGFPLLDLANAVSSLGPQDARDCVAAYLRMSDMQPTGEDKSVLEAAWLARCVGSAHAADDLGLAARLIACYRSGGSVLGGGTRSIWGR